MPEANESIAPFTLLGGILYLNEFELLPGLSADACRNIGRLRLQESSGQGFKRPRMGVPIMWSVA